MSVVQLHKRHMATTTGSQAVDDLPGRTDSYYWVPPVEEQTFTFDRRTIADRRATGKLESALEAVLFSDGFLRDQLVNKYGFCMHRVRLAKDRRTVFILWDANPGKAQACQQALERNAFRLRRDLAKVLRSKHTPYLEFRHDHLPPMQAAAAAALEAAERELAAMAAAAAGTAAGAQAPNMAETQQGSGPSRVNAGGQGDGTFDDNSAAPAFDTKQPSSGNSSLGQHDIDAAIRRLEDITRERQHRG